MSQSEKSDATIVESISNNLGAVFRHLFPGILIMGAACVAHRSWFCGFDSHSWQHISIAAVITVAAGNIWFAVNRYIVHQIIDYGMYRLRIPGPAPSGSASTYGDDLGKYVADSVCISAIPKYARQHIAFRASSVLLLYTIAEIGGLCSFWHEPNSLFEPHRCWLRAISLMIFVMGIWQSRLTRHIDFYVVQFGRTHDKTRLHSPLSFE